MSAPRANRADRFTLVRLILRLPAQRVCRTALAFSCRDPVVAGIAAARSRSRAWLDGELVHRRRRSATTASAAAGSGSGYGDRVVESVTAPRKRQREPPARVKARPPHRPDPAAPARPGGETAVRGLLRSGCSEGDWRLSPA